MLNTIGRRLSLATRVALVSGSIGVVLVTLAAVIGYVALMQQLDSRALHSLQGKRQLIRHVLAEIGAADKVPEHAARFAELLIGHDELHLAIVGKDKVLADFSPLARESVACCGNIANRDGVANWRSRENDRYTSLTDNLALANGDTLRVILSQQRADDTRLLQEYMQAALIGLSLLVVLVLAGAWLVTRTVLAPLAEFKKLARASSSVSLARRLMPEALPLELRGLANDFNAMLTRIDIGVTQLIQFSGDLAHEMRTPVGILLGRTQMMLSRPRSNDELLAALEANVEELERLTRLIDDMLFLARAENETEQLSIEPLSVRQQAQTVADFIDVIAAERGIRIEIDGDASVYANKILVQRAITNLLTNAIRHATENSVVRVLAGGNAGEGEVEVAVENTGAAIAAEDLARVFDRFYRVDKGRARQAGGAGLGLSIVTTIMRLHGGRVTAKSGAPDENPGKTSFTLVFPNKIAKV